MVVIYWMFSFNAKRKYFFMYSLFGSNFLKHNFFPSPSLCRIMQASHQLRFLREWAVFGRALRRSVWELLGVALALLLLVLAYSHTGHLVRLFLLSAPSVSLSQKLSPTHTHTHRDKT